MPNQRAYLLRIEFLKGCVLAIHEGLQKVKTPEGRTTAETNLYLAQGRLLECQDWLKAVAEHGDYGSLYLHDGQWVPKVPIFGSDEISKAAVEDRELGIRGENRAFAVRARERRHQKRSTKVAEYLDANAAIINDE